MNASEFMNSLSPADLAAYHDAHHRLFSAVTRSISKEMSSDGEMMAAVDAMARISTVAVLGFVWEDLDLSPGNKESMAIINEIAGASVKAMFSKALELKKAGQQPLTSVNSPDRASNSP